MNLQFYDDVTKTWVYVSTTNPLPTTTVSPSGQQPVLWNESDVSANTPLPVVSS